MPITNRLVADNYFFQGLGYTAPIEINYLAPLFPKRHFLECALGTNMGVYFLEGTAGMYIDPVTLDPNKMFNDYDYTGQKRTAFAYNNFFNLGYRYQKEKGFDFRVGATLHFDFGGPSYKAYPFMPYLGFGYAF